MNSTFLSQISMTFLSNEVMVQCSKQNHYGQAVVADLKRIYQSVTEEEALLNLEHFSDKWDGKYPNISVSWRRHWANLNTLFNYPQDIRKAIYTTNAIEPLNSVIRKAIKNRKLFPNDDSAKKVVSLESKVGNYAGF